MSMEAMMRDVNEGRQGDGIARCNWDWVDKRTESVSLASFSAINDETPLFARNV